MALSKCYKNRLESGNSSAVLSQNSEEKNIVPTMREVIAFCALLLRAASEVMFYDSNTRWTAVLTLLRRGFMCLTTYYGSRKHNCKLSKYLALAAPPKLSTVVLPPNKCQVLSKTTMQLIATERIEKYGRPLVTVQNTQSKKYTIIEAFATLSGLLKLATPKKVTTTYVCNIFVASREVCICLTDLQKYKAHKYCWDNLLKVRTVQVTTTFFEARAFTVNTDQKTEESIEATTSSIEIRTEEIVEAIAEPAVIEPNTCPVESVEELAAQIEASLTKLMACSGQMPSNELILKGRQPVQNFDELKHIGIKRAPSPVRKAMTKYRSHIED